MNIELTNKTVVCGEVLTEPKYSHEVYGEVFYEFDIKVMRLSDAYDVIPVTVSERLIGNQNLEIGSMIKVNGQFRSYNKVENDKSKLMLTIFIREFLTLDDNDDIVNQIEIVGYVCKEPIYRTTPFNREICDILLAVNRSYGKSDYIPCIAWGRNARFVKHFNVGDKVKVLGRIQSREYQKKLENDEVITRVAYEVSLSKINLYKDKPDEENEVDYGMSKKSLVGNLAI